jgi:Leucine-rich repeat (LRR) protein
MDEFNIYKGQKHKVKNKTFNFWSGNLTSIEEIEGLSNIKNLETLDLIQNKISIISGLEPNNRINY